MKRLREPSAEQALADRMRTFAGRIMGKYGIEKRGEKYDSAIVQTARARDTTAVWRFGARRILVSVEDVLWTNIMASQCMLTRDEGSSKELVESVVSDYENLWKLSVMTPDDAEQFVSFTSGVNWASGAAFQLSDEQLAMIITLCQGAPVASVDVRCNLGKKQITHSSNPQPQQHVRSVAWIYSTMGSGKSIVAWYAARHEISDLAWASCVSHELEWAASGINGYPAATISSTSPTAKLGVYADCPGLVKRVVWIVCRKFMVPQWTEVVCKNLGSILKENVHPITTAFINGERDPARKCAALMQSGKAMVIISDQNVLTGTSALCPLRAAVIVFDELSSMATDCMMAWRTLLVSSTPAKIFSTYLTRTMAETMYGNSTWSKIDTNAAPERRAVAWSRFAHMNPMPEIQIENSLSAIRKMPGYMEVVNVECTLKTSFGNSKTFKTGFIAGVFSLNLFKPKIAKFEFSCVSLKDEQIVASCVPYTFIQEKARGLLADIDKLRQLEIANAWTLSEFDFGFRPCLIVDGSVLHKFVSIHDTRTFSVERNVDTCAMWANVKARAASILETVSVECQLCGKQCAESSMATCCGSCYCAECAPTAFLGNSCCFCAGYCNTTDPNDSLGVMTAIAAAFRDLRADKSVTKFLLVASNAPTYFSGRLKQLAFGEEDVSIHHEWTVEVAQACSANPARIDVLIHKAGGDVDGLDMGVVDAIVTVGLVKNKQQLYSRALRVGTARRNILRVVQVAPRVERSYDSSVWDFLSADAEHAKVVKFARAEPRVYENASTGIAGFLQACGAPILLPGQQWGDVGAPALGEVDDAFDADTWARAVDRIAITFKGGKDVPYDEVEVRTPRVASIGGYADALDVVFAEPLLCSFIPPEINSVHIRRGGDAWVATWSSTENQIPQKLPKEYEDKARAVCLKMFVTTTTSRVFTEDCIILAYD